MEILKIGTLVLGPILFLLWTALVIAGMNVLDASLAIVLATTVALLIYFWVSFVVDKF